MYDFTGEVKTFPFSQFRGEDSSTRSQKNRVFVLNTATVATGRHHPSLTVRDGDEVTLPCNSEIDDHENCNSTEWTFIVSSGSAVELVKDGQIREAAKDKSDRLNVSEKCSLVIKNVTDEDAGVYVCRQLISGQLLGSDAHVRLSVVTMTEHEDDDEKSEFLQCEVVYDFTGEVTLFPFIQFSGEEATTARYISRAVTTKPEGE
ncbi:hypothetical protein VZT92_011258 [Zoarces viviparus]|uniref:Ig-like domain-containing protein n=1 Tax=Zoarces viviparus TaxID=48416 RepID=A0AAW1FCB0_ZOAVI